MKAYLEQLYDYNVWANGLILKYVEQLPEEQFTQETSHSHTSIRETLVHIMAAEWVWRERMQGNTIELTTARKEFAPENFPTAEKLYHRWFDEELAMRNFLGDLGEEGFLGTFNYKNSAGKELEDTIADVLTHVALHGMQHRAEVAALLTEFGFSPGNLDYSSYLHAD
jgi:uncharacterized damage-inducible protein DinB